MHKPGSNGSSSPRRSPTRTSLAALAVLLLAAASGSAEDPVSITVDTTRSAGQVNRWIFGNNMIGYQKTSWRDASPDYANRGAGIWDPERRRSEPALVAAARRIGLSVSRWPGGCAAHLFDWKKTVGPVQDRPDQQFGLPEFLQNCRDLGAEPLVTVAEYHGTARDAAELVEYLNAPDDGRHPWAARRAKDGHSAPWNVIWFEYGNESEHGDHHQQKMLPGEYARRYLEYRRAMRAVDPRIKLGAVVATGFPKLDHWARPVLEIAGREADFVIHHSYIPGYGRNDGKPAANDLFRVALAAADQIQDYYDQLNGLVREFCGGREVPIAVTEFNGSFVQERPVPYRHCLGNALVTAEMLRVFLRPRNHVVMANFWQFANEYWGAVKGYPYKNEPLVKRPQYYPFEFYRQHFGPELLGVDVHCGSYATEGGFGVTAASGTGSQYKLLPETLPALVPWQVHAACGVSQHLEGDVLAVDFGSEAGDVNYYHASRRLAVEPSLGYRLTAWIKTEAITSAGGVGVQIGDGRGYPQTRSAANTPDVVGTQDWTRVEVDYVTLPDAKEVAIQARRISGAGPVRGRAWIRDVRLQKFIPQRFGAVPWLGVNVSRSADGRTVYLMIVNKKLDGPLAPRIHLSNASPQAAEMWTLTGPTVDATNERDPELVHVVHRALGKVARGFSVELPPHSLTALAVSVQ